MRPKKRARPRGSFREERSAANSGCKTSGQGEAKVVILQRTCNKNPLLAMNSGAHPSMKPKKRIRPRISFMQERSKANSGSKRIGQGGVKVVISQGTCYTNIPFKEYGVDSQAFCQKTSLDLVVPSGGSARKRILAPKGAAQEEQK